jgi:hypothetical protein
MRLSNFRTFFEMLYLRASGTRLLFFLWCFILVWLRLRSFGADGSELSMTLFAPGSKMREMANEAEREIRNFFAGMR